MTSSFSRNGGGSSVDPRPTPRSPSLDELFDVLADGRRRHALRCLRESRAPVALADLARDVAARELDASVPDVPAEEAERVYASLLHSHVPKMADAGVVEYDRERDAVALSAERERLEPFVALATETE